MMDLDLGHLTEAERDAVFAVLRRDESLRVKETERVRKLKNDVKRIKLKGVIKAGHDPNKTCARCRAPFGWLFNKGTICPKCQHRVCDNCRVNDATTSTSMCLLCYKQKELEKLSGQWFYSKFRKSKRNRRTNKVITGNEIVRASIKRPDSESGRSRPNSRNNNASPKSQRSLEGESSDTQSMEISISPRSPRSPRTLRTNGDLSENADKETRDAAFPKASDREKLFNLIRAKSVTSDPEAEQTVEVKKVMTKKYSTDSSSSGSEPGSPVQPARTNGNTSNKDKSLRDSFRSSTQSESDVSSIGRITMVTERDIESDFDIQSTFSVNELSPNRAVNRNNRSITPQLPRKGAKDITPKSTPKQLRKQNTIDAITVSQAAEVAAVQVTVSQAEHEHHVKKASSRAADSMSSDSEDGATEQTTGKVKFDSTPSQNSRSQSPTPPLRDTAVDRPDGASDESSLRSGRSGRNGNGTIHGDVPAIAVAGENEKKGHTHSNSQSSAKSQDDEENIDEIFATHGTKSMTASMTGSLSSQYRSNLLSPFSESRESIVSYYSEAGEGNFGNIPITGEIQFGLDYNYKTGAFLVHVKQCRDLAPVDTKKKKVPTATLR